MGEMRCTEYQSEVLVPKSGVGLTQVKRPDSGTRTQTAETRGTLIFRLRTPDIGPRTFNDEHTSWRHRSGSYRGPDWRHGSGAHETGPHLEMGPCLDVLRLQRVFHVSLAGCLSHRSPFA